MAKLKVLVWMAILAVAAVVLLRSVAAPTGEDPAAVTMTVIRAIGGALAAYLLLATALAVRVPTIAPAFVRTMVAAAFSGGLVLAPLSASAAPASPPAPAEAPVLRRVPPAAPTEVAPAPPAEPPAPDPAAVHEVVVEPGDHLWSIAERALAERLGRAPSDAEIVPFWTSLIEANVDRLATGDPDLIFAGQVFRLPS